MMTTDKVFVPGRSGWRLNQVSLDICPGEVLALLGPNGAGKSSLLKVLSGELQPQSGGVLYNGQDVALMSPLDLAKCRAVLPQENALAFNFKAHEVVMMGRSPHVGCGHQVDLEVVDWAMGLTGVTPLASQAYTRLSGGERQRVHLARVLAQLGPEPCIASNSNHCAGIAPASAFTNRMALGLNSVEPAVVGSRSVWPRPVGPRTVGPRTVESRYLLLDEPTAALDIEHQHRVLSIAKNLAGSLKIGVLAILHDLNLAALYANRIAVLKAGRVHAVGLPQDIFSADLIKEVFNLNVSVMDHPNHPEKSLIIAGC